MGKSEVSALIASFNSMVSRMRDLIKSNEQEQTEKHRAEMDALQSQINPHFILNTLSSIRFFAILAKYNNIENMADALMKILKSSFKWDDGPYRISDEIELLKSYFYLMKIRYPERFKVEWDIDDGCLDYGVPRLILQPIVENAIVHGLEGKVDQGTIKVSIQTKEATIVFVVDDDGKGMEAELIDTLLHGYSAMPSEDHGIGMANVNRRIQLNFGAQYGIDIESVTGEGSHIKLTIPKLVLGE
jgi:two-component system sensor histidine kinase YesM